VPGLDTGPNGEVADAEVHHNGGRDDRDNTGTQSEPELALLKPMHHASRGLQPIGAPAREKNGSDLLERVGRVKQVGVACTRGRAANIDAADSAILTQDDGAASRGRVRV
jgi:hypothetical protein